MKILKSKVYAISQLIFFWAKKFLREEANIANSFVESFAKFCKEFPELKISPKLQHYLHWLGLDPPPLRGADRNQVLSRG